MSEFREVIERQEAAYRFNIEDSIFVRYLSDDAAADYAAGRCKTPQMPHIPGKPYKFFVDDLRYWLRTYFQKGGEPAESKRAKK